MAIIPKRAMISDSATKTVGGVDIAWMALTFNVMRTLVASSSGVLEMEKCRYGLLITYPLGREFTVSEHAS